MKILVYDNSFGIVSGATKYILSIIKMLSKIGEVDLLGDMPYSTDFIKHFHGIDIPQECILSLNTKINSGPFKNIRSNWVHIRKCEEISGISSRYDIFINSNGGFFYQIKPRAKINIMVVYFLMNPFHSFVYRESYKKIKNIARRLLIPDPRKYNFVNSYDRIVCISDYTKKWIWRYWGIKDVTMIKPPIPFPEYYSARKENIILSVSRFASRELGQDAKKRDEMIESFKSLCENGVKDFDLVLAGGKTRDRGVEYYIEQLKILANAYPVRFYFDLDENALSKLYAKAKIFWHLMGLGINEEKTPEKLEPFGMVTAEAMSYGAVPVVVNAGGQKEIVDNGENGFLVNNLGELVLKTKYLCENENTLKEFSKKARERSRIFAPDNFYSLWRQVFIKVGIRV